MPKLTFSEHKDLNLLNKVAARTITSVMKKNADKGKVGRWKKTSTLDHIIHAHEHLGDAGSWIMHSGCKEDVENALTRLAMALALWEGEDNGG